MLQQPPPRHPYPEVFLGTYSREGCALNFDDQPAPASGTIGTAARSIMYPIYPLEPFVVSKAWWCNGATVGTDSIDIGVYQMTDLATGRLDLIRSTGPVLSAGTVSRVQESGTWKVARANLAASSSSTDATNYDTASVTLKAGRLCLMAVENSHGTSATAVSAITGGGTWTSRSSTLYNSNLNRTSIWSCVPVVDYTGTINIAFGGTTQTGACWALEEFSGVDTATTDGIVQQAVGTGSSGTALATLAAFGSANNATFAAHGHAAATASAAGTGFTELADVTAATPAQALCTDWRVDNDTGADATFTSAAWGSCAVEVKADASPFVIPQAIHGSPALYLGFVASGTTATFLRYQPTLDSMQMSGCLDIATNYPLRSTVVVSAVASLRFVMAGFSSRSLVA